MNDLKILLRAVQLVCVFVILVWFTNGLVTRARTRMYPNEVTVTTGD